MVGTVHRWAGTNLLSFLLFLLAWLPTILEVQRNCFCFCMIILEILLYKQVHPSSRVPAPRLPSRELRCASREFDFPDSSLNWPKNTRHHCAKYYFSTQSRSTNSARLPNIPGEAVNILFVMDFRLSPYYVAHDVGKCVYQYSVSIAPFGARMHSSTAHTHINQLTWNTLPTLTVI